MIQNEPCWPVVPGLWRMPVQGTGRPRAVSGLKELGPGSLGTRSLDHHGSLHGFPGGARTGPSGDFCCCGKLL